MMRHPELGPPFIVTLSFFGTPETCPLKSWGLRESVASFNTCRQSAL